MDDQLAQRLAGIEAKLAELDARTIGMVRLGPRSPTPEEEAARAARMADLLLSARQKLDEEIKRDPPPPVDRSNLCTTDGRSPADARASQTNETGQHPSYIVLCDAERAKGFVRPYRDAYKHVGSLVEVVHDPSFSVSRHREGGCGSVTTMGRALSETYARDPTFYGATFCCHCNRHLPVSEFVWTKDGEQVGS